MISDLKGQISALETEAQATAEASRAEIAKLSADLTQAKQSLSVETERARQLEGTISAIQEELEQSRTEASN